MSLRAWLSPLLMLGFLAGHPVALGAHRLDEYLQATRLSVDLDRVGVEIDLTAGIRVAPQIFESIDTDGDGQIAAAEGDTYARHVLADVVLIVDGLRTPVSPLDSQFPNHGDMMLGVGVIRLRGTATMVAAGAGPHHMEYLNTHRPETSVYLANALVPSDHRIEISGQRRDAAQRRLALDYRVVSDATVYPMWWLFAALTMTAGLAAARRPGLALFAPTASGRTPRRSSSP
jgi:hypothetical protein